MKPRPPTTAGRLIAAGLQEIGRQVLVLADLRAVQLELLMSSVLGLPHERFEATEPVRHPVTTFLDVNIKVPAEQTDPPLQLGSIGHPGQLPKPLGGDEVC